MTASLIHSQRASLCYFYHELHETHSLVNYLVGGNGRERSEQTSVQQNWGNWHAILTAQLLIRIQIREFQTVIETLIKEVDHLMLNLFRYFGEDMLGAALVNKMLVQLFDVSKVLKMDIFRDINYQNAILFSLEVRKAAILSPLLTQFVVFDAQQIRRWVDGMRRG